MAEYIQKTDTLNQGREKLNEAIKDADKAKIDAGASVVTSNQARQIAQTAEHKADSVQAQFDQVVIEGDSSVEAAQARVDVKGQTHSTLKTRLDVEHREVTSQLAVTANEIPWVTPLKYSDMKVTIAEGYDWTPAIQHALDNHKFVFIPWVPSVIFYVSQLVIPNGVTFRGGGLGGWGVGEDSFASQLKLIPGTNKDMIIFKGSSFAGDNRVWVGPLEISGMLMFGDTSASSGNAIKLKTPETEKATIQDTVIIRDLKIRGFKGNGIHFTDGALPIHVVGVNFLFNGGYGILFETAEYMTQAVHFDGISGDGNLGGALIKVVGATKEATLKFSNIKSEKRLNSMYGNQKGQENALIFHNCDGAGISIDTLSHISSVTDVIDSTRREKPGSAIVVSGIGIPEINYTNVKIRVRITDTGPEPNTIEGGGRNVPREYSGGFYGKGQFYDYTDPTNGAQQRYVIGGNEWLAKNVETPGQQIQGVTPSRGYYATGQPANQKAWLESVSGGNLIKRTVNDDGTTGMIYETARRTGNQITAIEWNTNTKHKAVEMTPMTPTSAPNNGLFIDSTDDNKLKFKKTDGSLIVLG